ncbi:MAG: site-specific DNA-methyltransferase [Candidatus Hodarchaeota archaeon]
MKIDEHPVNSKKRDNDRNYSLTPNIDEGMENLYHNFDPHLDPQLLWRRKKKDIFLDLPNTIFSIKEIIDPKTILLNYLINSSSTQKLISTSRKKPLRKKLAAYQHNGGWKNRLILGDSLIVMNSLIKKENFEEKVQMIYFDPPYGIGYNTNFQVTTTSRLVKDRDDDSFTREPEQIKAYRDTWSLGIHSYLSHLHERLLLARSLLSETGSIFVQIGVENIHFVRIILDEVFGKENFCNTIIFQKTGSTSGKYLSTVNDFILWYAKNKKLMKYHPLYKKKRIDSNTVKSFQKIELQDGTRRNLSKKERENPSIIPNDAKLFKTISLHSQHYSKSRSIPFEYKGKVYHPPRDRQWSVSEKGMETLAKEDRIYDKGKSILYIYYLDDFPLIPLSNIWTDTRGEMNMRYIVQTAEKVVERCVLMTTDPGDLVFDPTCGSGTTAIVAERWGRRWITCDTSRIALYIAKERLISAIYNYFKISKSSKSFNFIYKKYPHISVSTVAYNKPPEYEIMYDKPEVNNSVIRVTGSFNYENITTSPSKISFEKNLMEKSESNNRRNDFIEKVLELLDKDGLSYPQGNKTYLKSIELINENFINAKALIEGEKNETVAISVGPEFGDVSSFQVEQAISAAKFGQFKWLIVIGFNFTESSQIRLVSKSRNLMDLKCEMVFLNPDVLIDDLLKKPLGVQMFTVVGQPKIDVIKIGSEQVQVLLGKIEIYDPKTGLVESVNPDQISSWSIDEDFNKDIFFIHQIIFPTENKLTKKIKSELKPILDTSKVQFLTGTQSLPFKPRNHKKAAVKIIDFRGNELIRVLDFTKFN